MERLVIRNFGPIKNLDIENVKPLTVLIGESGSGKSTLMKVLALFRWLYKMQNVRSFLKYSGMGKAPFRFRFDSLLSTSGLLKYLRADTYLRYENGACAFDYNPKTRKLNGTSQLIPRNELSLEKVAFISEKRNLIPDIYEHNASIRKSLYYLQDTYENYVVSANLVRELDLLDLGVRFEVKKTGQGTKHVIVSTENDSYEIRLNEASSGTQTLVPLEIIIKYYAQHYDLVQSMNKAVLSYVSLSDMLTVFRAVENLGDIKSKDVHIFVEEPELSLYPISQCLLMDYLVSNTINNKADYKTSLMLATHSPYIVNYLNVLLTRGDDTTSIRHEDLGVYRLIDGHLQDLLMRTEDSHYIVDTADMTEPMQKIMAEYRLLKQNR